MKKENKKYSVEYKCLNCYFRCEMEFERGKEALELLRCQKCECEKMIKVQK